MRAAVVAAVCLACGAAEPAADALRDRFAARVEVRQGAGRERAGRRPAGPAFAVRAPGAPRRTAGSGPSGRWGPAFAVRVPGARRQPGAVRLPVERTVRLMGTWATLVARAPDRAAGLHQLEGMVELIERTEASLSTWRADSALSALNRHPAGEPFPLPPALCGLWPRLVRWHRVTGGAFDPAVGRLGEAWGLRTGGAVPAPEVLRAARAATGLAHFRLDAGGCRVTRTADATLDAGAFGKGEALRRLIAGTAGGHPWTVDFGGQIAVGGGAAPEGWPVAVAHPARRHQVALTLDIATGSLATSGASERSWVVEGRPVGHLLDPRTGRPVHRPGSVTVWHDDPLAADILSTALYVMGPDRGMDFAERHGTAVLFLTPDADAGTAGVHARASRAFGARFPAVSRMSAR